MTAKKSRSRAKNLVQESSKMMSNLIGRRTLETEKKTRGIELRISKNTEIEDSEI